MTCNSSTDCRACLRGQTHLSSSSDLRHLAHEEYYEAIVGEIKAEEFSMVVMESIGATQATANHTDDFAIRQTTTLVV
jgi:hypothetical protein